MYEDAHLEAHYEDRISDLGFWGDDDVVYDVWDDDYEYGFDEPDYEEYA